MREIHPKQGVFICLLGVAALATSCAGDGREPVYAVKGRILYKGGPAKGAMVLFHKVEGDEKKAVKPFGRAGADGSFQVNSYNANDGAPEGEYIVTIIWPAAPPANRPTMEEGPDRLGGRLADPKTSKWRVKVEKKPLELEPFVID